MIALKKLYSDELLRLALVLSLLKANPSDILEQETQITAGLHSSNGSDWSIENEARTFIRPAFIHPKSLDNILLNYESEIFEELNSLGRYSRNYAYSLENNDRMSNVNRGPVVHTYVLNNLATDTATPALSEPVASPPDVQYEVKVETEDGDSETEDVVKEDEIKTTPDLVVTLSEDFLSNRSETDVFDEIVSRTFDVSEFLVAPDAMHIKIETNEEIDVTIKKEDDSDANDLYSDNANDDFVPYFAAKKDDCDRSEDNSVFDQNMSDLQDYGDVKDFPKFDNNFEYLDIKQDPDDFEQYLLENTPLDSEVYQLAPIFEEELVLDVKKERASTSFTSSASSSGVSEMDIGAEETAIDSSDLKSEPDEGNYSSDELTQEDMDLIEVLWKQDVDMGFCLDNPQMGGPHATKVELGDDIDNELKLVEEKLQKEKLDQENIEKVKAALLDEPNAQKQDPWAGLSYVVDTETGEYVLQGDLPGDLVNGEDTRFDLLEEALQLVELRDEDPAKNEKEKPSVDSEVTSSEDQASTMLHPAMARHAIPHHHPLAHYHNQSLMRSMSVEQRWQDLASLLTLPPPPDQYPYGHHQQHPHNIGGHAPPSGYPTSYGPIGPMAEKHHEPYHAPPAPIENGYKIDHGHPHPHPHPQHNDSVYYQNSGGPEMGNSDGFLQSILNDEDMQLMDMAMNEGMYTMRMLDGAVGGAPPPHHQASHLAHSHMMIAERDSASDSAVSSMGSERVPSLSDGEWCDAGSDSAQEYHTSKFRPYDASAFARDRAHTGNQPPQKKHHMFGKRCFQEQQPPNLVDPLLPEPQRPTAVVKYEYPEHTHHQYQQDNAMAISNEFGSHRPQVVSHHPQLSTLQPAIDIHSPHSSHALLHSNMSPSTARYVPGATLDRVRHNHTYSAPLMNLDTRPVCARDKRARRLTDGSMSDTGSSSHGGHLSRDEKRAKALGKSSIPLEVHDIINLPMDEFNERLSKHDLSEAQLSLIRDIRRRGKNKVAAQNCRKRKLDQITCLADELQTVRDRKIRTQRDYHALQAERQRVKERFAALYRHVFQNLRDPEGRPLSSAQYSLQQAADGNVVLVPKMPQQGDHPMNRTDDDIDRKTKNFDQ